MLFLNWLPENRKLLYFVVPKFILKPHFIQMENETELEEARRARREAVAEKKTAMERLVQYEVSNPGEYGCTFHTLNRVVAETKREVSEATSRLNALESNHNQRFPGICILT